MPLLSCEGAGGGASSVAPLCAHSLMGSAGAPLTTPSGTGAAGEESVSSIFTAARYSSERQWLGLITCGGQPPEFVGVLGEGRQGVGLVAGGDGFEGAADHRECLVVFDRVVVCGAPQVPAGRLQVGFELVATAVDVADGGPGGARAGPGGCGSGLSDVAVTRLHRRYTAIRITFVELALRAEARPARDERLFTSHLVDLVTAILDAPLSAETSRLLDERPRPRAARKG
jgi:hypothetical protein